MKCVCRTTCQARLAGGKIKLFKRGEVGDFEECPIHFEAIDEKKPDTLDFLTASEDELLEATWTVTAARKAIKDKFGITLKNPKGTKKVDLIDQILDARYRGVL